MAIRMGRNLPQSNHVPSVHYFYCCGCRTHVAIIYYIPTLRTISSMYLCRFRVVVAEDEPQHGVVHGMNLTVAVTYCVQCGNLLMWKILAVSQPSSVYRVGGSVMRLDALISCNSVTLFDFLYGGNNEQAPNDQDGGADEEQDGDINEQDLGANEQKVNQDGDTYEQDLGTNEQNVNQDGNTNEQDLSANEQNVDMGGNGGVNEQVPNEDVDIIEGLGNIDLNANI
ncbi:uncharacterized protein LOC107022939 [Solanum pennellii]|uniref:Uncharacterized protein LOC107022939 n=1 Tax=Solanum pennellii TaxID=28526 RepID=A0ABM1H1C0_SOLPN|nr:uncharacterized protein LOC107022939 [Solanum pennellii]